MPASIGFTAKIATIVALGGFLMGFDASVVSGIVGAVEREFDLTRLQLGWVVASLSLTATLGMMVSGPLSDRFGRRPLLMGAAALFLVSALASALAPGYWTLVAARMLGGLGVGAALILAPMYIAELAPPARRGRLVSINQLNIVVGISAAFFSNYVILKLGQWPADWVSMLGLGEHGWRWMLGVEAVPALAYLALLPRVPESPRWLLMHGREADAEEVLARAGGPDQARAVVQDVKAGIERHRDEPKARLRQLFAPRLRRVLVIGLAVGILQQITGINAVFFYAPMIFEQSGIGTDAAFMQAILVGLTNLVFTVVALLAIDRVGRRKLLLGGTAGIAACMLLLAHGFHSARYTLDADALAGLSPGIDRAALQSLVDHPFEDDLGFKDALTEVLGESAVRDHQAELVAAAIDIEPTVILIGILGFVASFAVSLGPVMWVLFSEIFPNALRGIAISFVGLVNSTVSFGVQFLFPWELTTLGNALTFLVFGGFALAGLALLAAILPETKGHSLEDLEQVLGTR